MGPVKMFFNRVDFLYDILKYRVRWLVLHRQRDCLVVNVFDDIVIPCLVDCVVSEVGAHYR